MTTCRILFKWVSVKADVGEFRQDSDLLELVQNVPVLVAVDVPFEKIYWANFDEVAVNQLAGEKIPPILTPEGMAYAKRELEKPFKSQPITQSNGKDEWDAVVEQEKKINPAMVNTTNDQEEWITTTTTLSPAVDSSAPLTPEIEDWGTAPSLEEKSGDDAQWNEKESPFEEDK